MLRTYVAYSVQKLRTVRKPVASHRALDRRKKILVLGVALMLGLAGALALLLVGCGGSSGGMILPPPPTPAFQPLTQAEVTQIVAAAAAAASADSMVIAVADRQGKVLGVFRKPNAPSLAMVNFSIMEDANDVAVALARTAAKAEISAPETHRVYVHALCLMSAAVWRMETKINSKLTTCAQGEQWFSQRGESSR